MYIKKIKILLALLYSKIYSLFRGYTIGSYSLTWPGSKVKVHDGGSIKIGKNCEVARGAMILTYGGNIKIGDNCTIQPYCVLYGQGNLTIGNHVRIATHTTILPSNHDFQDLTTPIYKQPLIKKGIVIEDNVWIGAGCRILDDVRIEEGCIIGAGSVLTKSTVKNGVYVGTPARLIKVRN